MKKLIGFLFALFFFQASYAGSTVTVPVTPEERENKRAALNSLYQFFKSYDTAILKALMKPVVVQESLNGNPNMEYVVNKNRQLISILSELRPLTYTPAEMNPNDDMIVFAGVIEMAIEVRNGAQNSFVSARCILDVIQGFFAIGPIVESVEAMLNEGVTWGRLKTFLLRSLKKYGGWAAAATVIYNIYVNCF